MYYYSSLWQYKWVPCNCVSLMLWLQFKRDQGASIVLLWSVRWKPECLSLEMASELQSVYAAIQLKRWNSSCGIIIPKTHIQFPTIFLQIRHASYCKVKLFIDWTLTILQGIARIEAKFEFDPNTHTHTRCVLSLVPSFLLASFISENQSEVLRGYHSTCIYTHC